MAKEFAKSFYKSSAWIKCRNSYIKGRLLIDGGLCEECHNNPGYIVHHKQMLTESNINNPDIALNHNNFEYVCKDCHDKFDGHGLNSKIKPLFAFDSEGQPVSLREIDSPHYNRL